MFGQTKGKAAPVHPNKAYGYEGIVPVILELDTNEGEWSVSYSNHFTLRKAPPLPIA